MTARERALAAVVARAKAAGKRVYGFCSQYASCAELDVKRGADAEWDRICVEGDVAWSELPVEQANTEEETRKAG